MSVSVFIISTVLISGLALASTGSQTWYLDSDDHSIPSVKSDDVWFDDVWVMERETNGVQSSSVSLDPGDVVFWLSDEFAASDVTFTAGSPNNPWTIYLKTDADWSLSCNAEVGQVESSIFDPFQSQSIFHRGYSDDGILEILLVGGQKTIKEGNYLAVKVTNDSGSVQIIYTQGGSWLQSPENDPGYPLPELITGILLSAGLVGLVVYIGIRRKVAFTKTKIK